MKVINLYGIERCDFIYYLAGILACANHFVAVVDNSKSQELFQSMRQKQECEDEFVINQNITYMHHKKVVEGESSFDYILVWNGLNTEYKEPAESIYIITDYLPIHLNQFRGFLESVPDKNAVKGLIFRDNVETNKVTESKICEYLGISTEAYKDSQIISYDDKDFINYLALLYNGRQTFTNLSPNYYTALKNIFCAITETSAKEAQKILNKAKQAKSF